MSDVESEIEEFFEKSESEDNSSINKNKIIEDKNNNEKKNSENKIKDVKNDEINVNKINFNLINEDIQININSENSFEKDNPKKIILDGPNISFNKNDKLKKSIGHHNINNTLKQEYEIKKSEENKEDLNTINQNIIIQNNKKIESNGINKISLEDCPKTNDNNILNKNFEDSNKENKDKLIEEIIPEKKRSE